MNILSRLWRSLFGSQCSICEQYVNEYQDTIETGDFFAQKTHTECLKSKLGINSIEARLAKLEGRQ